MWRKRDKSKMGIRTTQRELEEKIQKKQNHVNEDGLVETLFKQITTMSKQLTQLNKNVEELKNKEPSVITVSSDGTETKKAEQNNKKIFIPTVSTEGMSVSAGQVTKRSRRSDLTDSVDKLSEMENDND